jgi:hypothetical protein
MVSYIPNYNIYINQSFIFHRNAEQRKPIYASDSHLLNLNGHTSPFHRPFVSLD